MRSLFLLASAVLVGACAPSPDLAPPAGHPASPAAASSASPVEVAALAPAPQPDLPAVLRPDGQPPAGSMAGMGSMPGMGDEEMDHASMGHMDMDHAGMDRDPAAGRSAPTMDTGAATMSHTAMNHGRTVIETPSPTAPEPLGDVPPDPVAPTEFTDALGAYLALQDALASDRLDPAAAQTFARAFASTSDEMPAHDPHLWHSRSDEVAAVRAGADALVAAEDLAAARVAFGELSVPFAALVQAHGVPAGYDLARFTCGMAPGVPEGGVWLQKDGELRNPYFGGAMLTCGRRDGAVPPMEMDGDAPMDQDGMGHDGMNHGDMKQGESKHGGHRP